MSNFWSDSTYEFEQLTSFVDRERELLKTPVMNQSIANPRLITNNSIDSYLDFLKGKKLFADKIVTEKVKTQLAYKNADTNIDEDLNDNETLQQITQEVNYEAQIKLLKMYYDTYMSESYSDIKWRLGSIMGTVEQCEVDDEKFGLLLRGKNYTRSNMSMMYEKLYTRFGSVYRKQNIFSSLGFPPYKIGAQHELDEETNIMTQVLSENPEATFDQDRFLISREGFTCRDVGMKALSDYINFLQWVIDGACGIVSTYLTEWDLSVYIQEGLMTPQVNGKPMRVYLNYRIYDDNPFADADNELYTNDSALAFNVCGSAVSKLEADNEKYWRPSDFPYSVWWTPYVKDKDWKMKLFTIDMSASESEDLKIPYMSIYDEASPDFDYAGSQSLKEIIRNQDYIGISLATKATERLHYYDAFYSTPDDGLTDFDIKFNNLMKKVAGSDPGWSTKKGLDMDYALTTAKQEMLMNGGYYGGPQQVGNSGGYLNRAFFQNAMEGNGDSTKMTLSKMMSKAKQSGIENDRSSELSQTSNVAQESVKSMFDNSKNSAIMSKMTGINRLTAPLYGGPHGSSYSLYNLRSFYEDSQINRNIPRFSLEPFMDNFESELDSYTHADFYYKRDEEDYENTTPFYLKNTMTREPEPRFGHSPSKILYDLKNGSYSNYKYISVPCDFGAEEYIEGTVVFNESTRQYEAHLPERDNFGNKIVYIGPTRWIKRTIPAPKEKLFKRIKNWFNKVFNNATYADSYTVDIPVRIGKFKRAGTKLVKLYNLMDLPNTSWKIVQHGFETFMPQASDQTKLWQKVEASRYKGTFFKDCRDFIEEKAPCFMLKFDNKNDESMFIQKMIQYGRGERDASQPATLWFFEGNRQFGTSEIPESAFRAQCYVKYYKNVCEKYRKSIFGKEIFEGYSYTYVPFILVDLLYADQVLDNLHMKPKTNSYFSGENQPVHVSSNFSKEAGINASNPLEKFKSGYNDMVISYKRKHVSDALMKSFWSGVIMVAAAIFLLPAAPLLGVVLIVGCAINIYTQKGVLEKEKEQMVTDNGDVNWISIAYMGISGKGILSGFQGIDPHLEQIKVANNKILCQNEIKSTSDANTPIRDINLKYYTFRSANSVKVDEDTKYGAHMSELIITGQTYNKYEMPVRLKNAYTQMMTRLSFFPEGIDAPIYIDITVPFRNFFSWCVSQMNYLNIAEDVFKSADFGYLKDLLLNNVDKCVMKACGVSFNPDDNSYELIEKDTKHVLYNYWIDKAIDLYIKKPEDEVRARVEESFVRLRNQLQLAIDEIQEPLEKEPEDMTFNDFMKIYSHALSCEVFKNINDIDIFFFTYVNILYYYRLYFVGKRFNKEDGTMWMMRALESVIDLSAPNNPTIPPKSPNEFNKITSYAVAFYEKQNTMNMKRTTIITPDSPPLDKDKVKRIYVKVDWTTKDDWENYKKYVQDPINNPKVQKVDRFIVNGIEKFALVPEDGLYLFRSKEYDDNIKNEIWNFNHKDKISKVVHPYEECPLNIEWENTPGKTPIRWNVFGTINVNNLLEYSKDSITGKDLICLIEEGSDFWTIDIPEQYWPDCDLYRTGLYIDLVQNPESNIVKDAYTTVLGPFANTISPVVKEKFDPTPNLMNEILKATGKV